MTDPIDDLISGLPVRPRPSSTRPVLRTRPVRSVPPAPRRAPPTRRGGLRIPWWLVVVLVVFTVAVMGRKTEPASYSPEPARPAATVTVTVKETVTVMPASCRTALELIPSVMDDIAQLNGKSQVQIDITGAAHQAIFARDWTKLSKIEADQQRLYQQHQGAYQDFKKKYEPLQNALAACKKDAQ